MDIRILNILWSHDFIINQRRPIWCGINELVIFDVRGNQSLKCDKWKIAIWSKVLGVSETQTENMARKWLSFHLQLRTKKDLALRFHVWKIKDQVSRYRTRSLVVVQPRKRFLDQIPVSFLLPLHRQERRGWKVSLNSKSIHFFLFERKWTRTFLFDEEKQDFYRCLHRRYNRRENVLFCSWSGSFFFLFIVTKKGTQQQQHLRHQILLQRIKSK